jgi:hypothetical protein
VRLHRESDLLEVVAANGLACGLAGTLHRRKQKPDQRMIAIVTSSSTIVKAGCR